MNNTKKITIAILIILSLLLLSFFLGRITKSDNIELKTIKINIPEVIGKSDTIYKIKPLISRKDSLIYKDTIIYTETLFNKELADKYLKLEKESDKLKEYLKSIAINTYSVPFEDSIIKITGNFKTQGELISTQYDYVIKSKEIMAEIPLKKPVVKFLVGAGVSNTIKLDNFNINIKAALQRKNNDIILISYGLNKSIEAGYLFKF